MKKARRSFLQQMLALIAGSVGLFSTRHAVAAWPAKAFASAPFDLITQQLFADASLLSSALITIEMPLVAEDGALVAFSLTSKIPQTHELFLLIEKNPTPLAAHFQFGDHMLPFATGRVKMAESCNVVVVVRDQQGQLFQQRRWVNVVKGGCGVG